MATETSHARDVAGNPLSELEAIHREAMMDTVNMETSQWFLVVESARQLREERATAAFAAQDCARDGRSGASDGEVALPDFVPTCYHPGGIFEELTALAHELMRSPTVEGQSWDNIEETRSTPSSVKILLRECRGVGVTFLIPTKAQIPWSPLMGFQCVYESYFQDERKLWFPLPRLIASFARRRYAAISQFLNGSLRLAVAMMVMAAEIDVSMSVRAFEELTYLKSMGEGLFSIYMRLNYNVIAGNPNKTPHWQRFYLYVKSDEIAFEDPPGDAFRFLWNAELGRALLITRYCFSPRSYQFSSFVAVDHPDTTVYPEEFIANACAVALLVQESWENITLEWIRRVIDKISRSKSLKSLCVYTLPRFLTFFLSWPYMSVFRRGLEIWSSVVSGWQ